MTTFHEQFMGLSVQQREHIASEAGLSLPYIQKHMYVSLQTPVFHFHNAVSLDVASNGVLPFIQHTAGTDNVDWAYVRRSLNRLHKAGFI